MAKTKTAKAEDESTASFGAGEAKDAFARIEAQIRARLADKAPIPRFEPSRACSLALGTAQRILVYRDAVAAGCKLTDIAALDSLNDVALAAWHTLLMYAEVPGQNSAQALAEEARPLREDLLKSAELLAHFRILDEARVASIRAGSGYDDLAADLVQLSALYDEHWPQADGKVPVTRAMVERASRLGTELKQAVARRPDERLVQIEVIELRNAAFNLLLDQYNEVRRAISYLRWNQGDADTIAPSLYSGRRRSRPGPEAPDESPEGADTNAPEPGAEPRLPAE